MSPWEQSPSGLYIPYERPTVRHDRPLALDLFCGAGGFSLGMVQAGWHVIGGVEIDPAASLTYLVNLARPGVQIHFVSAEDERAFEKQVVRQQRMHERDVHIVDAVAGSGWIATQPATVPGCEHFWVGDVRRLDGGEILDALRLAPGELDCVVGGPPCQGFSKAGKREVMDPRNSLTFDFARLVCALRPKAMAMENVPEIASMVTPQGIPVIDALCRILEDGGFGGYDALRRSLATSAGVGAAIQGSGRGKRAPRQAAQPERPPPRRPAQQRLSL